MKIKAGGTLFLVCIPAAVPPPICSVTNITPHLPIFKNPSKRCCLNTAGRSTSRVTSCLVGYQQPYAIEERVKNIYCNFCITMLGWCQFTYSHIKSVSSPWLLTWSGDKKLTKKINCIPVVLGCFQFTYDHTLKLLSIDPHTIQSLTVDYR